MRAGESSQASPRTTDSQASRDDGPERLYTLTGGRSRSADPTFDLVTFVVARCEPTPGMPSEQAAILRMCAVPLPVVEIACGLDLPVGIVKVLLGDLHAAGLVAARTAPHHERPRLPRRGDRTRQPAELGRHRLPDAQLLKQVLVGLQRL